MKEFTVYSKDACAFCTKAKALLDNKGRSYQEIKLGKDIQMDGLLEAIQFYGHGRTMPMIIRTDEDGNTYRIGGFTELEKFFAEEN